MKKSLVALLVFMLAFAPISGVVAYADNPTISVTVEGKPVTFNGTGPVVVDGRTLVPLRGVFEALDFEVVWEESDQIAVLMNDEYVVVIEVGLDYFDVNGEVYTIGVPAQIINGRVMVPLRVILENIGYSLSWDGTTSTISIKEVKEDETQTKNLLVGQWEMNREATTDALYSQYAGTGVTITRAQILDELSKIETTYLFKEDGTGTFTSKSFGNGTISWSSDGTKLKMKLTPETGKSVTQTIGYKVTSTKLIFYADNGKIGQVFRRVNP